MPPPNKDRDYLAKLQDYYADFRCLPSYASMGQLLGLASKSAVSALVKRLQLQGFLETSPDKRLVPTKSFFGRPMAEDVVRAGLPSEVHDGMQEALNIDEYLIDKPSETVLIEVKGDSMIEAHIQEGDIAVVEKRLVANPGDIVVAIVDGEFTLKYLEKDGIHYLLRPGNSAYPVIRPTQSLQIFGVMVGLIRKM
ncbi:LexA family transcriptional regulator [Leeia sp. TBRC 13508]|uniref:LexA family transcriptional regulator n=1 Tax=Leeia speluncae TaxID=2884804 RepID=A0ABS8D4S4_9NEIS|nr:LexA family transcriptional regulator [Leeia speluncae]MCB6183171.1 LexA family transcriptional regulator [Leeia speluncae]